MATAPKTKVFDGKKYTNYGGTTRKAVATQTAQKFRKTGKNARVYKLPGTKEYYVYAR